MSLKSTWFYFIIFVAQTFPGHIIWMKEDIQPIKKRQGEETFWYIDPRAGLWRLRWSGQWGQRKGRGWWWGLAGGHREWSVTPRAAESRPIRGHGVGCQSEAGHAVLGRGSGLRGPTTRLQQRALLLLPRASELESLFASLINGTKEPNTYPLRDPERQ